MTVFSTSSTTRGSRRKRRRARSPSFSKATGGAARQHSPKGSITLDVVVVRGCSLLQVGERARVIKRIDQLARSTSRSHQGNRGPWVLVFTRTNLQSELGRQLNRALVACCQGVIVVKEGSQENSTRAALALHRLHFPSVTEDERHTRILVLGSVREQELFNFPPSL